ncbi:MAG: DEAD/DEAH box helicase, partial [Bacteroidales bacterium]|nr:DEAD/DEAH box helicase [Bacteroidales bacterium]
MNQIFQTDITYLKGVGVKRAEILNKEVSIRTFFDLLMYFPYKYIDKSKYYKINEIQNNIHSYIQLKGTLCDIKIIGEKRGKRLLATLQDGTGYIDLVWFNGIHYIEKNITKNKEYIVFGKAALFGNTFNITHPEITELNTHEETQTIPIPFQPFYNSTETMKRNALDSKGISKLVYQLFSIYMDKIEENLPEYILSNLKLIDKNSALFNIHFPQNQELLKHAQQRLKFEEMFFVQLHLIQNKLIRYSKNKGFLLPKVGKYFNDFYYNYLPFELTSAQKKVIKEIRSDFISGKQMNRLLQGDVGSGKTITSLLIMLIAIDNGYQCCLMAPTEILANQHFESISRLLKHIDIKIELLT